MEKRIEQLTEKFLEESKDKEILIISHFDTDGITSATIMIKTLKKLDKRFSVKIIKNLEKEFIQKIPKEKLIMFLDLASGSIQNIIEAGLENVFIIDHHELSQEIPEKINIINPELYDKQKISGSGLTYLFCKKLFPNKELAKLAVLGMIGDGLEKELDKLNNGILEDGEIKRKRGVLIYPSTRPINRTLEYCSNPYIPGVTGNVKGVLELLREIGLNSKGNKFKSLIELDENEMQKLVTAIMLRIPKTKSQEILGDLFLINFFGKLEDARELSAKINACSRMGESQTAIQYCMECSKAKKRAEAIHTKYRQQIVSGLKFANETEKIQGKGFVIINAKKQIKDTIAGTIASILSHSSIYEDGTIIIVMAYSDDKIKISARNVKGIGRNVRELLTNVMNSFQGEVGGHKFAAGALIPKEKEQEFIDNLKKHLELEIVKI